MRRLQPAREALRVTPVKTASIAPIALNKAGPAASVNTRKTNQQALCAHLDEYITFKPFLRAIQDVINGAVWKGECA